MLWWRKLRYGYRFRRIRLSGPRYAKVDPEDYEWVSGYEWFGHGRGRHIYAKRFGREGKAGEPALVSMHREIVNARRGIIIDHINRDSADNRKANLRQATHGQNQANKAKNHVNPSSRYKGVSLTKGVCKRKWRARIQVNRRMIPIGSFESEIDAAKAYDKAAKKYFGEFAYVNFPESSKEERQFGAGGCCYFWIKPLYLCWRIIGHWRGFLVVLCLFLKLYGGFLLCEMHFGR